MFKKVIGQNYLHYYLTETFFILDNINSEKIIKVKGENYE